MARVVNYIFPFSSKTNEVKRYNDPTKILTALKFSRETSSYINKIEHAGGYGVYFLFDDDSVYIGKTTNFKNRLRLHLSQKDFWNYGILITTENNSFNQTDIDYLEYKFLNEFKDTDYSLNNSQLRPTQPNISQSDFVVLEDHFNEAKFLLEVEGLIIENKKRNESKDQEPIFSYGIFEPNSRSYTAQLEVIKTGEKREFIAKEGSIIRNPKEQTKNYFNKQYNRSQNFIIKYRDKKILTKISDSEYKLVKDIKVSSPSEFAALISGSSTNGWTFFKDLEDKVER